MILLIDNYDSFTYNLYQMVGALAGEVKVVRNDAITVPGIINLAASHIIISPGPGRPNAAGVSEEVIRCFGKSVPILGVCLGHQAISEVYGGQIVYAPQLMHGKTSTIQLADDARLFQGLPASIDVGRYHSLVACAQNIPAELRVTAQTADGVVMAVEHRQLPVYGLQFHPESILTPCGKKILSNFLAIKRRV